MHRTWPRAGRHGAGAAWQDGEASPVQRPSIPAKYHACEAQHFQAFARAIRGAGVEPKGRSLHSLRHTFALQEYYRTGDIYYVKGLLGHSAVSVTERYLQFPQECLERVLGRHVVRRTTAEYVSELTYRKPPFSA